MFHTHAPLPRGFFMEVTNGEELLSVSWSRKLQWLQNTGKWVDELARRLSLRSWCQFSMSDRASICILRACCDKVCVVVAKWLARWAKSSAVKIWHGSVAKSVWSVSIFSRIAALASLSLLRMLYRILASWWIRLGTGNAPTLAALDVLSSITDSWGESWYSDVWSTLSDGCHGWCQCW